MDDEILSRLRAIEEKLELVAKAIETLSAATSPPVRVRKKKERLPAPTAEEIAANRDRFASLYQRWMEGREIEVRDELDGLELEELRRFADANNLNVTSKMSKQRTFELISARFREKRQLHKPSAERGGN